MLVMGEDIEWEFRNNTLDMPNLRVRLPTTPAPVNVIDLQSMAS
jgi:hypothetical protein